MRRDPSLNALGNFLKARRAELDRAEVGPPDVGLSRQVTGLRPEEVARLAAITTDYYLRVEEGRIHVSALVLEELARVLRLDSDQRAYVFRLARRGVAQPPRRDARQMVRLQLIHILDDLNLAAGFVIGRRTDLLAWNRMAAALVTEFAQVPEEQRNYVRMLFTDPAIRRLYTNWEGIARMAVAHLRLDSERHPGDALLAALVDELSARDPQFRKWWRSHSVVYSSGGRRLLHHPVVGDLALEQSKFTCAEDPEQQLVVWTAEPGSPSFDALRILASHIATPDSDGLSM